MGIVHHGIYVLLMEEARVELLRHYGVLQQTPLSEVNYPVLSLNVDFKKPLHFDDQVEIQLKLSTEKARFTFEYTLNSNRFSDPVAFGKTEHVAMDMATRKPIKVPQGIEKLIP